MPPRSILRAEFIGNKGYNSSQLRIFKNKPRFLIYFTLNTVVRAFALFKLAANAYPLIAVFVVFFLYAVYHKILAVFFDIANGCVFHIKA